jgi:hypothetical protein
MSRTVTIPFAAAGLLLLALGAQSIAASPPDGVSAAHAAEPLQSGPTGIDDLRNEVAELRRKVEKPPKDIWDKISSISGPASALMVALVGFYATNIYNRRQRAAEDRRKEAASNLENEKFEAQKKIEKVRFDYERQRWREELSSQVALKHVETRLTEYSALWSRVGAVATHRRASGELTQAVARELASHVENWRYSMGGLLAEPTTRDAAFAFQRAAWDYDETKEGS